MAELLVVLHLDYVCLTYLGHNSQMEMILFVAHHTRKPDKKGNAGTLTEGEGSVSLTTSLR
jgi:hypothetical protein